MFAVAIRVAAIRVAVEMPPSSSSRTSRSRAVVAAKATAEKKAAAAIIHGNPLGESKVSQASSPQKAQSQQPAGSLPAGVVEDQRALYFKLKDQLDTYSSHPVLGGALLTKAKIVFENYVLAQWRKGDGLRSTDMTLPTTVCALEDIGVQTSLHQVKDLIFGLNQSQDIKHHNAKIAASAVVNATIGQSVRGEPIAQTPSATSTATNSVAQSSSDEVNFETFLNLLMSTLGDLTHRDEMGLLWHMLDADGDDTLSADDLALAFRNSAFRAAAGFQLSGQQLQELLTELDVDSDGTVTQSDFFVATNSN